MPKVMFLADFGLFIIFVFGVYFGVKTTLNIGKWASKKNKSDKTNQEK